MRDLGITALPVCPFSIAKELGIDYELVKVADINEIISFGVMMTPALAVDGEVKVSGKVPDIAQIKELIS